MINEKKVILFYAYLPFLMLAIYLGYTHFSKKTYSNDYFYDAPTLMLLDKNLTIINEDNKIGDKYIEMQLSNTVNKYELKNILETRGWKTVNIKPLIFKKNNIFCEVDPSGLKIKFRWR